jgi:hypothetical protein
VRDSSDSLHLKSFLSSVRVFAKDSGRDIELTRRRNWLAQAHALMPFELAQSSIEVTKKIRFVSQNQKAIRDRKAEGIGAPIRLG